MKKIIAHNRYYFGGVSIFMLTSLLLLLFIDTGDCIFFFSKYRSSFSNEFFRLITKLGEQHLYIASLLVLLFVKYRYAILIPVTGLLVTVFSYLTKRLFSHPRPSEFFNHHLEDFFPVDGVHIVSGYYSFPSGHTLSAFTLCTVLALISVRKKWWGILFFIIAFLVGISRVYLIQHFLKDVVVGALLGTLLGIAIFYAQERWAGTWANGRLSFTRVRKFKT